jgi:hypothetical protein
MEKATREETKRGIETIVPAIQAEQVEDDEAPVTAEYVPAKMSDREYEYIDLNTSV